MKRSLKLLRQHMQHPQKVSKLDAGKQRKRVVTRKEHSSSTSASVSSPSNSSFPSRGTSTLVDGRGKDKPREAPVDPKHGAVGSSVALGHGEAMREHTDVPVASARGVSDEQQRHWNATGNNTRRSAPRGAQKQSKTDIAPERAPGTGDAASTVSVMPLRGIKTASDEHRAVVVRGGCSGPRKTRYILFAGDLRFDTTPQQIKEFFRKKLEPHIKDVRMVTHRGTNKSKGCAFVEFDCREALQVALNYHHRELNGRKVNIELSAGGGGNSESRIRRIREKNKRLKLLRRKTFKAKRYAKRRAP